MAAAAYKTCTKCLQSFPLDHFLRHCNHACHNCASCQGVPTDGLTVPFSPLPSSLPLPASTLSLASAPTTTATATASTPSHLTPPLPLTVFLTKDSPTFHGLQQQLNDQVSALSDIAASLQHLLASSHNPEPQPPQPPSSQPVAATLASAMLPAANTAGSALGAPLPGCFAEFRVSIMVYAFTCQLELSRERGLLFSSKKAHLRTHEVIQQVIDNTLPPQDLGRLCNPDLLPVDDEHKHAVLVNSVLIKSIPSVASTSSTHHFTKLIPDVCCFAKAWTVYTCIWACATNNPNLGAGLGAFLLHSPPTSSPPADDTLATPQQPCGPSKTRLCGISTSALLPPSALLLSPPHQAAPTIKPSGPPSKHQKGLECQGLPQTLSKWRRQGTQQGLMARPAQRPPPLQGSARHINGPMGPSDLSTPPLQGLAQLVSNSASTLDLGTPLLQGSAQSVIMPVGLGGTRTPPLQGLAWLFDLVPAALNVPSADQCLSLLLDTWSHNPGPCPNTSFASNVFDPASQPARHGSMQEHAFAWSTLLSLYPDPIYCHQLLSMTKHGCLLSYDRPLIQYEGLQDLLAFVSQNPGCLLWKGDLQDTFWHIMTAEHDVHLLGFSYDGIHYCENVPTFGGSSSLWLFNLVTEFLNWLVMACLPTNWPINHYLDDTFGAIPASHAAHTLLPIHTLALAANALGLRLSPKKTFGASTKLKVLVSSPPHHSWQHMSGLMHAQRVMVAILGSTPLPLLSLPRLSLIAITRRTLAFWKLSLSLKPYDTSSLIGWVPPSSWCMSTKRTSSMASTWDAPTTHSPNVSCGKSSVSASSTTSQSSHTALQVPHMASPLVPPVLASPLMPPTSCGTALPPAPTAVPGVCPCPSSPSASDILGLAHPVFQPRASNCWSGSPTSPALVTLFTWPSTGLVPSDPTMWTLALTPQVSPATASSTPCTVTSTCTVLATQVLSSPSPCRSSTRSSSPWERWLTSSPKAASSFRWPLPLPLPASSAQASLSGTVALTAPPSSQSPPSGSVLEARKCCSSALALPASTLSPSLPSSPSSAVPSRLAASRHCNMLATLSVMVRPPGHRSTAPPLLTSSHSAGGALTATAATLTDQLRSAALWLHRPSSLSAMAPWFPAAPPGEIQAWPDPSLLAPNPIETALSCTGASTTGLAGRELLSSSPHLDPCNPFSVFSSQPCPCPI
ncbi:uncharacterized protein UBRO_20203 [Ustilago bromivora]|uniref:Reverse transcriptase domain-containing protein n=1 Tax=Ustilago bromivora TaxID=307758 RepID=A0A1K0HGK0_9BASI|nr:uncharacterized protein UBRO_20203 [Ustilago bromivora]